MSEKNIEDFISTVSHELRTPLTSIRGFSQTMLNSWDKLDDESKKKFLKIIEEQSNRLINLTENMLSVTKLQDKQIILKEVSIKPVVQTAVSVIKNQYPTRIYKIEIGENIPPILADKDKFAQVMMNLIENAAKYSDEDSTITIKSQIQDDFVALKVINTGIGIDECDYEKIFTKFSRVDNPLTRKAEGSGLGLYITKNLVEKMDGKIEVQSKALDSDSIKNNPSTLQPFNPSTNIFTVVLPAYNLEARVRCSQ